MESIFVKLAYFNALFSFDNIYNMIVYQMSNYISIVHMFIHENDYMWYYLDLLSYKPKVAICLGLGDMVCHPSTSNFLIFSFIENLIPRHFSNNAIFHSAQFSSGKVQLMCNTLKKNGGKICRISTFFVSTDQNSALSLVAPCSVCQEKLKFVIVDSSTRRSNSIIIEFLFNFQNKQDHMGCLFNWVLPYLVLKRK